MADQSDLLARGREVTVALWGDRMKSAPGLPAHTLAPEFFGLVTRLGGEIAVESELGTGSRFTVRVPRLLHRGAAVQAGAWEASGSA